MRSVIFIGSNWSGPSREGIRLAKDMGLFTVLFTNKRVFLEKREKFPDVHEMVGIDLQNIEALKEEVERLIRTGKKILSVTSFKDAYVATAALLAEQFCDLKPSGQALATITDKIRTRQALEGSKYNANWAVFKENVEDSSLFLERNHLHLPVVIKPPKSNSSYNVLKAETRAQFENYIYKLHTSGPYKQLLVEEHLEGPQYLVEVLVYKGAISPVAFIKQEIPRRKRFIITGYSLSSDISPQLRKGLTEASVAIVKALNLNHGSCHLELRCVNGAWKLVEANPRMAGGAVSRMVEHAYGINLVKETLKLYLGLQPELEHKQDNSVFTQYLVSRSKGVLAKVSGQQAAISVPGVKEVVISVKPGDQLSPPLSMGYRYAYVLSTAQAEREARNSAKTAALKIGFEFAPQQTTAMKYRGQQRIDELSRFEVTRK